MSRFLPPVSDEDLHALVDGELDPARRDAIFSFLSGSPADAAKVDVWRRQNEAIRASFARIDGEPVGLTPSLTPSLAASGEKSGLLCRLRDAQEIPGARGETGASPGWRARFALSALLASFAGGVVLTAGLVMLAGQGSWSASFETNDARQEKDAAFLNRARLAFPDFSAPERADAKSDPPSQPAPAGPSSALVLPNLSGPGLRLTGVKMNAGDKEPMICLLYAVAPAGSLALCAEKSAEKAGDGGEEELRDASQPAQRIIWWRQSRARYAVSGSPPETELRAFAERARSEIDAFAGR